MYLGVIRSRPTVYSKVAIQQNRLNRKNITQYKKYKCNNNNNNNNIKLICLTSIHFTCTSKFEKHKQSNAHEKHKRTIIELSIIKSLTI